MPRRDLLKANLFTAWKRCIEKDYCSHRINSERSLQASFWAQLNDVFDEISKARRMFIEPAIGIDGEVYYPDLLICNSREIIGVLELKYTPRSNRARVKKDVGTLCRLATYEGELSVANSRYLGPARRIRPYRLSRHVVFGWAGVHRESEGSIKQRFGDVLNSRGSVGSHSIFQLHAVTNEDNDPHVFSIPTLSH